jgi:hypothetical protein
LGVPMVDDKELLAADVVFVATPPATLDDVAATLKDYAGIIVSAMVPGAGGCELKRDDGTGQGAQSGLIQTAIYVGKIVARGGALDERWIRESFDVFYTQRGAGAELVTRLFLGHPYLAEIAQTLIAAANGSERFASSLFGLISDSSPLLELRTPDDVKAFVTRSSGEYVDDVLARSADLVAREQDAHKEGLSYFTKLKI